MANITKRQNKDGSTAFLIRVFLDETPDGKQVVKSMTWKPPANMKPTAADKQAEKEAVIFEQKCRSGVVAMGGNTPFGDYCRMWLKVAQIAPKTRENYEYLMQRIQPALGHIRLERLQAHHIESFYQNLREEGVKGGGGYATPTGLIKCYESSKYSQTKLAKLSGVARITIAKALDGKRITGEAAKKISVGLQEKAEKLFKFEASTLSDETVVKYHRLIRAVLAKAKREQLIPFNPAAEHVTPPKTPRREAKYLDDIQAREFLTHLINEPDIRYRTALTLALFTGIRRGELCGLSWPDVNMEAQTIRINKAAQYLQKRGLVEVRTKNTSSVRIIDVPKFVMEVLGEYRIWWAEHKLMYGPEWKGDDLQRVLVQDNGLPLFPDTINKWLDSFIEKNNLPRVTPHNLRHTFATLQITAGVDMRTLQSRTGHAQASTLINTYSHAIKSAQEKASAALEAVLLPRDKQG